MNALGIDPVALGMQSHRESYADIGAVSGWVTDLETRWEAERDRRRIRIGAEEASFTVGVELSVPPPLAWE